MGLLLRSSPLSGSTEGEEARVTVREGGSEPVSSHTHYTHYIYCCSGTSL